MTGAPAGPAGAGARKLRCWRPAGYRPGLAGVIALFALGKHVMSCLRLATGRTATYADDIS
jgi:hypothetical protein